MPRTMDDPEDPTPAAPTETERKKLRRLVPLQRLIPLKSLLTWRPDKELEQTIHELIRGPARYEAPRG